MWVQRRLKQPRQDKNLLYWHDVEPTKEEPFHMYSLPVRPHLPTFQQSAGATTSLPSLRNMYPIDGANIRFKLLG
jgi:hypothetical protein